MNAVRRQLPKLRTICTEATETVTKRPRNRRKNLAEVASYLPERGLGAKFTRLMWIRNGYENSFWTVTCIKEKNKGRLGYYGKLTWKGVQEGRERPVQTAQKRGWRFILDENENEHGSVTKSTTKRADETDSKPSGEP